MIIFRFLWYVLKSCSPLEHRHHWRWIDCWKMAVRDGETNLLRDILYGLYVELGEFNDSKVKVSFVQNRSGYQILVAQRLPFVDLIERRFAVLRVDGDECIIAHTRWDKLPEKLSTHSRGKTYAHEVLSGHYLETAII